MYRSSSVAPRSLEKNPADIPTRPLTTDELNESDLWWHGPEFLKSEELYPVFEPSSIPSEVKAEMKEDLMLNQTEVEILGKSVGRFSNGYEKSLRVMMRIAALNRKAKYSTSDLREKAHKYLIRTSLNNSFSEEIKRLQKNEKLTENNQLFKLTPFLEADGILRTRSRLNDLKFIGFEKANPIILQAKCPIGRSIIENAHVKVQHTVSLNSMLASLFEKYHFLGLTNVVRDVMKMCIKCRKRAAKKVPTLMAPLK